MSQITQLSTSHSQELARLNMELVEDEGHSNSMSLSKLAERMRSWLADDYLCYGIVDSERILAYCLFRDEGSFYYIRQLFTDRAYRKQGLASRLLRYLENEVLKGKPVRLDVLSGNSTAMAFYSAMGYQVYGHTLVKDV